MTADHSAEHGRMSTECDPATTQLYSNLYQKLKECFTGVENNNPLHIFQSVVPVSTIL